MFLLSTLLIPNGSWGLDGSFASEQIPGPSFFHHDPPSFDTILNRVIVTPYPIRTIISDNQGILWASTGRGLEFWDEETQKFVLSDPDFSSLPAIRDGKVVDLLETGMSESALFDPYSEWNRFLPNFDSPRSTHVEREEGLHWVCNGRQLFEFRLQARPKRFSINKPVRAVSMWKNQVWASTFNNIEINGMVHLEMNHSLDGNFVEHQDTLYGFGHGLFSFPAGPHCDAETHLCPSIDLNKLDPPHFGLSARDTLWVGAYDWFGHRKKSGTVEVEITGIEVRSIREIREEIWILEGNSGITVRKADGTFERLESLPEDMLTYDALVWGNMVAIASNQGLVFADFEGNILKIVTSNEGLMSSIVCGLALDKTQSLWFSTYAGLHRLTSPEAEPEIFFPEIEFNRTSVHVNADANLHLWGSMNGVYVVSPDDYPLPIQAEALPDLEGKPAERLPAPFDKMWGWALVLVVSLGMVMLFSWIARESSKNNAQLREKEEDIFLRELEINVLRRLPNASVEQLAEDLDMSLRTLYRRLAQNDTKPGEILKSIRIKRAAALLERGLSLEETADRVGYSPSYLEKLLEAQGPPSNT